MTSRRRTLGNQNFRGDPYIIHAYYVHYKNCSAQISSILTLSVFMKHVFDADCFSDTCRREALRRWKSKQGLRATYGHLLELCVKAGHSECAKAVCQVLRDR